MLKVENLSVSYKKINAVRDISFELNDGEIVSLIGANGAGKTTTLKTISGLLTPKSGTITYNGVAINGKSSSQIVEAGMVHVPEGRHIFPNITVEDNLLLGGYSVRDKDKIRERVRVVYDLFPILRERKTQKGGSLSGGEQQMLALGRALISGAPTLLLDEPSLGLAPIVVEQVFDVIVNLREQGKTILLVEQNATEALAISDRTYVMESGQIILSGSSREVAQNEDVQKIYLGGN